MGNRAVICFDEYNDNAIGIYLHWNGGRDSIEGFLKAARQHMGGRLGDSTYAKARLVQDIGVFLSGNLSLGLDQCKRLDTDNGDNGTYVIDSETLTIKQRLFMRHSEQAEHNPDEMADFIIKRIAAADAVQDE